MRSLKTYSFLTDFGFMNVQDSFITPTLLSLHKASGWRWLIPDASLAS